MMCVCFVQAPDWVDAEECHRCRVQFGVMTRKVGWAFLKLGHLEILWLSFIQLQCIYVYSTCAEVDLNLCSLFFQHHCRACGQIFCGKCSSKYSTIPKFGIEKEVRVCEPCFELLNKWVSRPEPPEGVGIPVSECVRWLWKLLDKLQCKLFSCSSYAVYFVVKSKFVLDLECYFFFVVVGL